MLSLEGRTALVTGGGRGIGRAVSILFGRLGARVAVNYVSDEEAAEATAREVRSHGVEAVAVRADLSRPAQADELLEQVVARLGPLDVLVVNHGIWRHAPILEMTPESWRDTMSVNLDGAFAVCQAAARHMVPRGTGAMVLVASTAGQRGEAEYAHYAATKGALIAFTRSLAAELAPHGIRVNAVAPGWVLTDMTRAVLEGPEGPRALSAIPLGRAARPEEIAGPVAFLASPLASYMYGEVLAVNGGAVMAE
ncbi:MAG TPA: 3-oxoacyl-ACP reductase family protein [Vicinamibacteria bacterium]|nr:3-oxoacyl-ACP reductase family protein [Vicinamibacteria bacterium]